MYLFGIFCLVVATAALPASPDPPKLPNSAAHQDSKIHSHNQNAATAAASLRDQKSNEEVKKEKLKIAPVVIPPPPQLPPFDYSILQKQKADQKQKYEDSVKQKAEKYKKEKEPVNPEKPLNVEVTPNPEILSDSKTGIQDLGVRTNNPIVSSDTDPVADKKDNETAKNNVVKNPAISIPPPPELPPFDYSILRKQKSDEKQKYDDSEKQKAENSKKEKEPVNHEKPLNIEVTPNPEVLSDSKTGLQDLEVRTNNPIDSSDSDPVADKKDNKTVKNPSISIPPPPQLPPFDYSILQKQKTDQKQKYEDSVKQKAEKYKKEKEPVNPEKPLNVEVTPNPEILSDSKTGLQDLEVRTNNPLFSSDSDPVADKKDNETVKDNIVKNPSISIPPPPELPPFDYSILRKQKSDEKQKYENSEKQKAENYSKNEKEPVNHEKPLNVEVTPNPEILSDFKTGLQDLEVRTNNPIVSSDSDPVADKKNNETVNNNIAKNPSISIPPPPELPPFDYSILRKQKSDQNLKSEYSTKPAVEKPKEEKEATIPDQEKPVKIKVSPNPATLPNFVTEAQESEKNTNIVSVATDSTPIADKKDDKEVKKKKVKIPSGFFPPPPELQPFDYSTLRKQKANHDLKSEYSTQKPTEKSKKDKKAVILNLEQPTKVEERPNSEANTVTALPVSGERTNILNEATEATVEDKKDNEKVKMNVGKIASDVIPPPPELPPFDYSTLREDKGEQKQKSDDFPKYKAEKSEKDKEVLVTEKPVEIKVEESKLVGDSKPIEESKPVEESKPKEKQKNEPVKHSEDIPVTIKMTIPPAPFLSKLISNYPPGSNFGLNWPLKRPSMSRPPRIIYPNFNGIIHTN